MRKLGLLLIIISSLVLITGCVEVRVESDGAREYTEYYEQVLQAVDRFTLDNFQGPVSIHPSTDGKIRIQAVKVVRSTYSDEEVKDFIQKIRIEVNDSPTTASVKTYRPTTKPDQVKSMSVNFLVYIPPTTMVDVKTSNAKIEARGLRNNLTMQSSNGSLDIKDLEGTLIARTSNGAIRVERTIGDLRLDTSNGSVDIDQTLGHLQVTTSNGKIEIGSGTEAKGAILRTSNGAIEFRGRMVAGEDYELNTSNGRIQLWLDIRSGYDFIAETSNGEIKMGFPFRFFGSHERNIMRGELFGGGTNLRIRTSNSDIIIQEWGANGVK